MKRIGITALLSFGILINLLAQYDYIENPRKTSENKLPTTAHFIFDNQQQVRPIVSNPNYLLLNGMWKFYHSENPEKRPIALFQNEETTKDWAEIPVPGNWQMYGYDYPIYVNWWYPFKAKKPKVPRDFNPVGTYYKQFTLGESWFQKGEDLILHFGGVNSCFFVNINGNYVGYSQDSKLPAEFNVTKFLQKGKNSLVVEVYRYCDGSYLEGQDMWKVSGIERDVYLYKKPKVNVEDFKVQAIPRVHNGQNLLTLDAKINANSISNFNLEVSLRNSLNDIIFSKSSNFSIKKLSKINFSLKENITDLNKEPIKLWSPENPYLYQLFLTITDESGNIIQNIKQPIGFKKQEIKNGIFYVNDEVAEIRGVNRHEHDAKFAHAVGYSEFAFNRNAMIEDLLLIKSLGFNAVRTAHYPNHPMFYELCDSIGLWVCDEANVEAHYYMMFRPFRNITRDPSYREAIKERISNMYHRDKNFTSIFMWSVGNENGTGKTMVEAYDMLKSLDTLRPVFNERHFFLNLIKKKHSDFNGNMYAKPERVKKIVKRDTEKPFIWIEYAHAMGNSTGNFVDLWEFIRSEPRVQGGFIWDWRDQGLWTQNADGEPFLGYGGHFEPKGVRHDGNFCANGVISADGKLHPAAYEIQYIHQNKPKRSSKSEGIKPQPAQSTINPAVFFVDQNEYYIKVSHPEFEVIWTTKGQLKSYKLDEKEVIKDFGLNFWRASTDNDFGNRMPQKAKKWRKITDDQPFKKVLDFSSENGGIKLVAQYRLPKGKRGTVSYLLYPNGELNIEFDLNLKSKTDIPRVGSYMILNNEQSNIEYWGNGPHENYSDRKTSTQFGLYELDTKEQEIPYIRPQEYGNRTDVVQVNFPNFSVESSGFPINFSAWNHSLWQIDEFPKKAGLVPINVKPANFIWANFDFAQRGLGGDNSWGRKPYDKYLLKSGRYQWSYKFVPKNNNQ